PVHPTPPSLYLLLLSIPPPPPPPLFPYTTLFRSSASLPLRPHTEVHRRARQGPRSSVRVPARCRRPQAGSERSAVSGRASRRGTDRKSTRLNSSHLGISYAVFCLKKKKKKKKIKPSHNQKRISPLIGRRIIEPIDYR